MKYIIFGTIQIVLFVIMGVLIWNTMALMVALEQKNEEYIKGLEYEINNLEIISRNQAEERKELLKYQEENYIRK